MAVFPSLAQGEVEPEPEPIEIEEATAIPVVVPTQTPWIITATPAPAPVEVIPMEPPSLADVELVVAGLEPVDIVSGLDKNIDELWPWLVERQDEYARLTGGRFMQVLESHFSIPAAGDFVYPEGWFLHPTDQQYRLSDALLVRYEPLPFMFKIDVYDGPEGVGFVTCFRNNIGGQPWERCRNYGPEALRSTDWQPITIPVEEQ